MAIANELVIKISGDIKSYTDSLKQVEQKTEDLSGALDSMGKKAAVVFAAMTAEIGFAVAAQKEAEKATKALTQAMANQGIYSRELLQDYQDQAEKLQDLSGISDEATQRAQAIIQAQIGQRRVTEDLTLAMGNLAAAQNISIEAAAEMISKGLNGQTRGFKQLGITIDEHLTKQEKTDQMIAKINEKYRDFALNLGSGLGSLTKTKEAFGDLQEEIGKKFAPALELGANLLTKLFKLLKEPFFVELIAGAIGFAATLSGIITALVLATKAFLGLSAVATALGVSLGALTGTAVLIAAAIAGIGYAAYKLYENWDNIWAKMLASVKTFFNAVYEMGVGFKDIMKGVFTFDTKLAEQGAKKLIDAFNNANKNYDDKMKVVYAEREWALADHLDNLKDINDKKAKERISTKEEFERQERDLEVANRELQVLEAEKHSELMIEVKKKEIEIRKLLADENYKGDRDLLKEQLDYIEFAQTEELAADTLYQLQKQEIERKSNDQMIKDKAKFGATYAELAKFMRSEELKGAKTATGELEQLTQSSNATLKGIGKAAALANIAIKTAESAMNIYAGFSQIPIIGPALGVAGAVAAVAFGAEQAGKVMAAADGGLITGGIPGRDSVPVMAMPGELVVPTRNYEEVVSSVAASRTGEGAGGGYAEVVITLKDELIDFIEAKLVERDKLGLSIQGA